MYDNTDTEYESEYEHQSLDQIESLDQIADIQACLTKTDLIEQMNCIRTALGLPPVTSGNIPTVDNATIDCLKKVFAQFHGTPDASGNVRLPFQSVITMINSVRACLGLPSVPFLDNVSCITSTCLTGTTSPTDISDCVKTCLSQHQV